MRDYDRELRVQKDYVTRLICQWASKGNMDVTEMSDAISTLNKAWDNLTDALIRQRQERDDLIRDLLDQLAERKPR